MILLDLMKGESNCANDYELVKEFGSYYIMKQLNKRNFERCMVELEARFLPILKGLKTDKNNVKVYEGVMQRVYTRLNHLEYRLDKLSELDMLIEKKLDDIKITINNILQHNNNGEFSGTINTHNTVSEQTD